MFKYNGKNITKQVLADFDCVRLWGWLKSYSNTRSWTWIKISVERALQLSPQIFEVYNIYS